MAALLGQVPPPPRRDTPPEPDPAPDGPPEAEPVVVEEQPAPVVGDTPAPAVSTSAEVVPVEPPKPPAVKPKRPPAPKPPAELEPPQVAPGRFRMLQVRIPARLFELARQAKDEAGDTHEVWFLDAFDETSEELAEHYRPRPNRRTRMPQRQRRTRRPSTDPLVSYPLRLTEEEIQVLEERRAELGTVPSLADLVTVIVQLRLRQLGKLS